MAIDNIEVATQINDALIKQNRLLAKSTKELKDQLTLARSISEALDKGGLKSTADNAQRLTKGMEGLSTAATDATKKSAGFEEQLGRIIEKEKGVRTLGGTMRKQLGDQFPTLASAAAGFVSGATDGFKFLTNVVSGTVNAVTSLGTGIFSLAKSIIAIPFKILGGLVDMANSLPNSAAFGEAREAIRKDFGTFAEDLALTTKTMYKNLRGELSSTGLTAFRVFGNMAERLKAVHEIMVGMGPIASEFKNELRDPETMEAILAYQKGLGASNEQMRQIAISAKVQGRTIEDVFNEITIASAGMADAFGLSTKALSKDVIAMTEDIANFGSMTVHEMSRAAVYVRKLGLEIKDVIGVIDRYDNFEDAAMGAAQLAQAFGANVDALQMMKEQDPTKRLDMLRQSMVAAGVDAEKLSRQELKLLAQQTGLSEEAAKTAFALKNQGVSMEDLEKQQAKNEKKTLTQEEAMARLSDSIERLIKTGDTRGGFFTQFFEGFERGIKFFSPFRQVLRFIRRDLRIIRWLGIETGRAFVNFFPGVMDIVEGLMEFFKPERFRALKEDLAPIFKAMFDGDIGLEKGLARIKDVFLNFFDSGSEAGKKILNGLHKFGSKVVEWLAVGIRMSMKALTKAFSFIADFIANPTEMIDRMKAAAKGSKNPFVRMLEPMWRALSENWQPLADSIMKLLNVVWDKVAGFLKDNRGKILGATFGMVFAPAAIQAALAAVFTGVVKKIGGKIKSMLTDGLSDDIAKGVTKATEKAGKGTNIAKIGAKFGSKVGGFLKVAGPAGIAAGAALGVSDGLDRFMNEIDPKFDETTRKMAAAGAGIISGLTFGLLPDGWERQLANILATVQDAMFGLIENIFGRQFLQGLKRYINPVIDVWDSIGDTIVALISGDEKKFDAAIDQFLQNAMEAFWHGMQFLMTDLVPNLMKMLIKGVGKLGEVLTKAVSIIWNKVGDLVANILQAIFGEWAGIATRGAFKFVDSIYVTLSDFAFKTIPNVLSDALDAIMSFFDNFGERVNGAIEDVIGGFTKIAHYARNPSEILSAGAEMGSKLVGSIKSGASSLFADDEENLIAKGVKNALEQGAVQAKIGSEKVGGVFSDAMDTWTVKFKEFGQKAMSFWNQAQASVTFKDEADKLKTEGISLEDMSLYKSVKDIDPAEVEKTVKTFRESVVPLFIGKGPNDRDSLMGNIRYLANQIGESDMESIGKVSMVTNFAKQLTSLSSALSDAGGNITDPGATALSMAMLQTSVGSMMSSVTKIAESVSNEEVIGLVAAQTRVNTVTDMVENLVRDVVNIDKNLQDVKVSNVRTKLKNMAKSLGVKNERFKIENEKIKLQVQLNVQLEAEQLAYQIKKGEWFTLQPGPRGFPKKT